MTEYIQVSIVQDWITRLQDLLKAEIHEGKADIDLEVNLGMRHGLDQIKARLDTWLQHHENMEALSQSGKRFVITKDVNLSHGRYRKLEWYQDSLFFVLAWRHGMHEQAGELMLEIQDTRDLSKTYLVYRGSSSYDELAALAREGEMEAVRNERNRQDWVEKVWL